jgi:hypothetical protein
MKTPWIAGWLWLLAIGGAPGQKISFRGIETTYDGRPAQAQVSVDGSVRQAAFSYREIRADEAPAVFSNRIPEVLPLSYNSVGFAANSTSALGNLVELDGSQRVADHVEVVMVTWATAAKYPALASLDSSGYRHPLTASIYQLQTDPDGVTAMVKLDEATAQVQIPWRPATLPDGSVYPYNGYAFKALIPLAGAVTVPGTCIIAIGFNTKSFAASPLGMAGPYEELNLALTSARPTIGRDPNANAVFWVYQGKWYYPASNWGGFGSPILRLSARATPLPSPALDATFEPVNAGVYQARASILPENLSGDTVLTIAKAPVIFETAGLTKSVADPDPFLTVLNRSPGLAAEISYDGSSVVPTRPGKYPFAIVATDRNHRGTLSGDFHLTGKTYAQWQQELLPGELPAGAAAGLAYATGGDPRREEQPLQLQASAGGMTARFNQRREMSGLRLALEFSPDLSQWRAVETQAEPTDDFWEIHTTTSAAPGGFFRLKAEAE